MNYDPTAMAKLFNPASVAVVGASRRTGPGAFNVVENLLNFGYKGRIYPVNPKATEIMGLQCYARAQDLPEVPDLAIVTVPRELLPEVIRDCCDRGLRLFILVPQGLKEADERGAAIQAEFMSVLKHHGARALGPNTLGTVNTFDSFTSSFMPLDPTEPVGSAMICQTGLFLPTYIGATCGLGLGIDVGNQADLGFPDALRYLGEEPRIGVVAAHMEGLRPGEGRDFLAVARQAVSRKPVLIYKTGTSAAGAQAAGSHSGSLAGSHQVYQAAFRSAGVISLEDVDDLDDSVKAFLNLPPIKGKRVAVVTVSGGGGIMAADACERYGLELARFAADTTRALRDLFPPWADPGNPLDIWPASIGKDYAPVFVACFDLVAGDPGVDGIVCVGGTFESAFGMSEFLVLSAERREKPITWWLHGAKAQPLAAEVEASHRIAVYPSADRAVRALARLAAYHLEGKERAQERPERPPGTPAGTAREPASGPRAPVAPGAVRVMGAEAFGLLEEYGLPVARRAVAETPVAAAAAAARLGFPVVVKAIGPDILHKSELGAVRLDLPDADAVVEAGREVLARVPAGTRLLVQEFHPGGHEVILGAKRDPHFGPIVLFGLGGVFTEVLRDVAIGLAPLGREEALRLVEATKGYAVLRGVRGQEPADVGALVGALVRLSWLVTDRPDIVELDLNPVKVFRAGQGCVAVDARILAD